MRLPTRFYYDGVLPNVEKPSRYIGGELNLSSSMYSEEFFNVLLVFPDTYEIGMSHQGLRYLYHRLTPLDGVGVEFAFAPWPDAERLLRRCGESFRSWQTGTPANRFDLIGFSLTYELHYTNLLMILELAGLALESAKRREHDAIVIAGGPCCSNPLPFIDALDAVCLGDGEEALPEAVEVLAKLKTSGAGRTEMKEALAGVAGFFVDGVSEAVEHRSYRFRARDLPREPIVPSARIIHDRLAVEIMRGCVRGCRFCHAGVFYRPRRERSVNEVVDAVCRGLDSTGWQEVSLLSLSTSDYSHLDELLRRLGPELERRKVSLALPSLRPETVTKRIVDATSIVRRSGFTLAPEAGTGRLRRVINKRMTDAEILEGCRRILKGGWQNLKLYFMIGLPTETDDDLDGIVTLTKKILELPRRRGKFKLGLSVSPFVPKPFTPFQWERQCSLEEFLEKEAYLKARIRGRNVQLSLRDPAISTLEGIFARGSRGLWRMLVEAYRSGCRFDGWRDQFDFGKWQWALEKHGLTVAELLSEIPVGGPVPWSGFAPRVKERYLLKEREKAFANEPAPDVDEGDGSGGGESSGSGTKSGSAGDDSRTGEVSPRDVYASRIDSPREGNRTVFRYRFVYEKTGRQRFLSHLETMNLFIRALRCSGLPLYFTEGFHPHPRISMGPSLAVGMEGSREFFDVELTEAATIALKDYNALLPEGIRIAECTGPFTRRAGKLPPRMRFRYELRFEPLRRVCESYLKGEERLSKEDALWYHLGEELGLIGGERDSSTEFLNDPVGWLTNRWGEMFERGDVIRDARGRERSCRGCSFERGEDGDTIELTIHAGEGGFAGPRDLLAAVLPKRAVALVGIRRNEILYETGTGYRKPEAMITIT